MKDDEQRRIVAYLDGLPPLLYSPALAPGASVGDASRQAKVNALRGVKPQTEEELDALLPSVLALTPVPSPSFVFAPNKRSLRSGRWEGCLLAKVNALLWTNNLKMNGIHIP